MSYVQLLHPPVGLTLVVPSRFVPVQTFGWPVVWPNWFFVIAAAILPSHRSALLVAIVRPSMVINLSQL